jgi:hypothetical protein
VHAQVQPGHDGQNIYMHTKLEDWKNGWFGVELGISPEEIDPLIAQLRMLKEDYDQHFHISSDYKAAGGVGDITVYVQSPDQPSNMESVSRRALAPGEDIDRPKT